MNISTSIHDTKEDPIVETLIETETQRSYSTDTNIKLYSTGFFDCLTGLNAEAPHLRDYWQGYQIGYREYCCGLLGGEIPIGETPTERLASLIAAQFSN